MANNNPSVTGDGRINAGFGATIAAMRRRNKLPQREVAKAAHLDASYIAALERGDRTPPPLRTVARLAHALRLTECESRQLQGLAAAERIAHAIECNSAGLQTGPSFAQLVKLVPALNPEALSAVCALIETLAKPLPINHEEISM